MKKKYITLFLCISTYFVSAQISINDIKSNNGHLKAYEQITANNIDTVFVVLFDSISSNTDVTYNGIGTNVNWYKYTNLITPINVGTLDPNVLYPDDATGYVLEVDGKRRAIWIINYKNHFPAYNSIAAEFNPTIQCENLNILLDIKPLTYQTLSGTPQYLPRDFKVSYQTKEWTDSWKPIDVDTIITLTNPVSTISLPAPLIDTYYTISEDLIASELGLTNVPKGSQPYSAVAIRNNLTSVVTERLEDNENERPSVATQISISAPVEVQFLSNSNEPVAKFYNWTIYKDKQMVINRTDKDHRYTFSETGVFKVKLITTNGVCTDVDSITITVSESRIEVPNVFTPNGDEWNNEFRVAFKSIVKFDCWVYNRWGRLVYHWTDPTKGWDGTINGKKASAGPYFYVIKAQGSDFNPDSEPDKITKRRLGEYLLKGDINLLRGGR